MKALVIGSDYLAGRFAYLLKKLSVPAEASSRFSKGLLKGKDAVFFSGKSCLAKSMMDSLRQGCSVFSEQLLFDKASDLSLVRYAERNGLSLSIGSFDVFNPVVKSLKNALSWDRIQELFFNRVGPRQFGYVKLGIVDDLVIQDLGIIVHMLGEGTSLVSAFTQDPFNHCIAHLRNGSANIFLYANKNAFYKERTIDAYAERTRLHANILSQRLTLMRSEGIIQSLYGTGYESSREQSVRKAEPLRLAIEEFLKGRSSYDNILKSLELSLEIKKRIAQVRPIS